jgi:hypothetical protein
MNLTIIVAETDEGFPTFFIVSMTFSKDGVIFIGF